MKKNSTAIALIVCFLNSATSLAALITSLDDIQNWTGTGSNRAGLVIQWNDGGSPTSLAWGYRWNGSATGEDMLKAVAGSWQVADALEPTIILSSGSGSESRVTLGIHDFGWGTAVNSITFTDGGVNRTRADWNSGYWEYFNVGGSFDTPHDGNPNTFLGTSSYPGTVPGSNWISSWSGFSLRALSNGSWDGWSFAPSFASVAIVQPYDAESYSSAAVPEPGQIVSALLTLAGVFAWGLKRHISKKKLS